MKKYIDSTRVRPLGELGARTALLAGRMTDGMYRPEAIFTGDQNGWPGDWEGRAILAQALLSRVTGVESAYLKENVAALSENFNERGYLKYILPDGEFNEQQLSGHGWLIRGLCEYAEYSGDSSALDMAMRIAETLFLPTAGHFADYPVSLEERAGEEGEMAGNIAGLVRGWHVSTDTGCAFIPMDGLSRLYQLTGDERLLALLDEMHGRFMEIDVVGSRVQTHATLSACRGILRLYGVTGDEKYLASAAKLFDTYVAFGMTANYANHNWFERPEWTEPCAIIDSFIVAMRLYEYKGDARCAHIARRIWANGVCRAQRPNGGFGCDSCAGEGGSGDVLKVHAYEAYWCCTMRGGEAMEKAARFGYLQDGDSIIVPMLSSSVAEFDIAGGNVRIRQRADAAREGRAQFVVEKNTAKASVALKLLVPDWAQEESEYMEFILPAAGESVDVDFGKPEVRVEGRRMMQGDHMLGQDGDGKPAPIADAYLMDAQALMKSEVRVLFD